MESLGKKLTDARLAKKLDFNQISRETNITRRYLEALETEDFSIFPGEPYLLGFLRNYADYLGLDSNELLLLYKNICIQEAPIPLKDLMPTRPLSDRFLGGTAIFRFLAFTSLLAILALLVWGSISLGRWAFSRGDLSADALAARQPVNHDVTEAGFRDRVYAQDTLTIQTEAGIFRVTIEETAPSLRFDTPTGPRIVDLGQDLSIDLSGDDIPDIRIFVADLFKNDPTRGADIHVTTGGELAAEIPAEDTASLQEDGEGDVVIAASADSPTRSGQLVLFEGGSAYPVTMTATFRGYCLFRFEADRTNREERYYQKSEQLTVQANNGIRIWASNGNSVKIQMVAGGKTVDLALSRPGEVIVRDLKWIRDEENGRFKFMVLDID